LDRAKTAIAHPVCESELRVRIETHGTLEVLMLGPLIGGAVGLAALLIIYLGVLSAVSGWSFTVAQLEQFWPYIVALGVGFGIQVALYLYLRRLTHDHHHGRGAVAASGTTSTAAMLACCTHYLANILPILGAAGAVTFVAQYQLELFWVGLAVNAGGILYIARQCYLARQHFLGGHACLGCWSRCS
jgi:Cu+-exporting ATPase